ncbi:MAG: repressor LexA [Pseudomonadales bacterium]|jgi:repressor LexA|nr:repressor LexA [Pseudomonadales bacterium]MBL6808760.1 repressor LexA [Pseudomonadales bacterium]
MERLTPRQSQVLDVIRSHIEETGYPPTRADIARSLGFRSANAAEEHLKALARKGAIALIPGTSRGLKLLEEPTETAVGLPIIGRVAAGQPILAVEHVEDHSAVPPSFFKPAADFLLRVHGESMRDVGILDGDLLAVAKAETARNGQIVVARVGDEVTVKRYQREGQAVRLVAENPEFSPIEVDLAKQDFAIEGLAVGVLRQGV